MVPLRLLASFSILFLGVPCVVRAQPSSAALPAPRPPVPAAVATPIDFFRQLLAAPPGMRLKLLAGKPPDHRKVLENSLRSYDLLPPQERELRLRNMELRYRLTSLLRLNSSNRLERLNLMPEADRPFLKERLRVWDQLSPDEQELLLAHQQLEGVLGTASRPLPRSNLPVNLQTSNQLHQIEEQLVRWQRLPEARKAQVQKNFKAVFEFSALADAKERISSYPLAPDEFQAMQRSYEHFKNLPPAQRDECLRNFEKFTGLSPSERRQFLISAQHWQRMNPQDRAAWRKLVSRMPPLPPRNNFPPLPRSTQMATTN